MRQCSEVEARLDSPAASSLGDTPRVDCSVSSGTRLLPRPFMDILLQRIPAHAPRRCGGSGGSGIASTGSTIRKVDVSLRIGVLVIALECFDRDISDFA